MPHKVSALIPAAGMSRRMGRPKLLLPFGERAAIELLVATLEAAGLDQIVIVLGPDGDPVARLLAKSPAVMAWNRDPDSDMAGSLRAGRRRLDDDCSAVLICLGDHPLVGAPTARALCTRHREVPERILVPTWGGRRGHPILVPSAALAELDAADTLRDVVRRDPSRVETLEVLDAGILFDLDTPGDYRRALEFWADRALRSPLNCDI